MLVIFVFCRQKAAYELRISAWSSDVCSSDLRLDQLVSTARRMDETMAELLDPPRQPVNLSQLIERMAMAYGGICEGRGVRLSTSIDRDVVVRASDDLLETVLENGLDHAVSFSPEGGHVQISLRRAGARAEGTAGA